jgi:outer membrane protein
MATAWKVVIGVACACTCAVARAQVVKLEELEARVTSNRPEAAISAARLRQAAAEIGAAQSAYYPTFTANIDGTVAPGRTLVNVRDFRSRAEYLVSGSQTLDHSSAFRPQPRYGASLGARGLVYDFGRTASAVDAAHAKARASEAEGYARAQALVMEVRAAYLRWSMAYALWQVARQAEAEAKARADRIAGLIAEGAAPPSAATGASVQANAAATESERAELELETARLELGFVSAKDLGPEAEPDPDFLKVATAPGVAASAAQPPAGALPPSAAGRGTDTNPQIEALEQARAAAEAARRMQARMSSPAIAYRLNAGLEGQDDKLFPIYGIGIGVTIPLWDGGATSAAEAGARAAEAELAAQLELERARDKHMRERRGLQIAHAERVLALAETALALAETRVQQLMVGPTLATAEQEALAAAQADRTKANAELVRARAARVQLQLGL